MTAPTGVTRPVAHEQGPGWAEFAAADPDLHAAHRELADVPWRTGTLEPKVRELLLIAADATASGSYAPALPGRIANAAELGASAAEIAEVLAMTSIIGIHTSTAGTSILLEEMQAAGQTPPAADSPAAQEVRAEFERRRGYWSPLWEAVAAFDPDFLRAYLDYSSIPVERAVLDARVRELVLVVVNAVTTHLFPDGLRVHVRTALALGVTGAQIMETFELLSTVGVRSLLVGLPLLNDHHEEK